MRLPSRKWRWLGLVAGLLLVAFVVIRTWVVPAILLRQIEAQYHGKVVFRDWWFGLHSAGVTGVELHETPAGDSPAWFSAERISTDVSLARLIRGRLMPTRITIERPKVVFRLDDKGQPITKIPVASSSGGSKTQPNFASLPDIVATDGELTFDQQGRKPMHIKGVDARLAPVQDGGELTVKTDDPTWGQVTVAGHFDPSFKNGRFEIATGPGFVADPEKLATDSVHPGRGLGQHRASGAGRRQGQDRPGRRLPQAGHGPHRRHLQGHGGEAELPPDRDGRHDGPPRHRRRRRQAGQPPRQGDRWLDRRRMGPSTSAARSPDSTSTSASGASTSRRLRRPGSSARSGRPAGSPAEST